MGVRQDEVRSLIKDLFQDSFQSFSKVEMKSRIQGLNFNIIMKIVADKRFYGREVKDLKEGNEFKVLIREFFEVSGASNPGEFIPFLQWIDFQGFKKRILELQRKTDSFAQNLIEEHRSKRCGSYLEKEKDQTLIDALLSLQETEPDYYTDDIIKGNILVRMLIG